MREVVKRVSLTQPAPIQVDSTEPDVIEMALEQIPGRAIVNSVNLEAGRAKLDRVVAAGQGPRRRADRADDRRGRDGQDAPTARSRSPSGSTSSPATSTASTREALIFDVLTFTLTTGDDEWKPVGGRDDRGHPPDQGRAARASRPRWASPTSPSASPPPARAVLNSVFLHHCVEAGLDLAMVNPNHITPYGEIPEDERELADDLVFNRREDALEQLHRALRVEGRGGRGGGRRPHRGHGARGGAALAHPAPQEGRRRGLDRPLGREDRRGPHAERGAAARDEGGRRQVRRRRADPALRAPVGRGDEARRRPAGELPRPDRGPHQGHGRDRHRVRRRARHRQVARQHDPHQQRLHGHRPRQAGPGRHDHRRRGGARGRRRSASPPCSSRPPSRCRSACRSCTSAGSSSRC